MSCYICQCQASTNELCKRAVLGSGPGWPGWLQLQGCSASPSRKELTIWRWCNSLLKTVFCFEHCLLLELPHCSPPPQSCQGLRIYFLDSDTSQSEAVDPKLSTAESNTRLKPGPGIYIHPFTLLGFPQKTVSFSCPFKIHFNIGKVGR